MSLEAGGDRLVVLAAAERRKVVDTERRRISRSTTTGPVEIGWKPRRATVLRTSQVR